MNKKVLIPLFNDYVAPRFDLATEVLIIEAGREEKEKKNREGKKNEGGTGERKKTTR